MAHWKKSFPSRYVQVSDLEDGPLIGTISKIMNENVGGEQNELKLVAYFGDLEKRLVVNQTRAEAIATIARSADVDSWIGVRILMALGSTRYQGKKVACIDVKAPPAVSAAKRRTAAPVPPVRDDPPPTDDGDYEDDEEAPF